VQQTVPSLDDLVGGREQHGWYGEAKRLGGLEVDHQLEPSRRSRPRAGTHYDGPISHGLTRTAGCASGDRRVRLVDMLAVGAVGAQE